MSYNNFDKDNAKAKGREAFVSKILLNHYQASGLYRTEGNYPFYDYSMIKNESLGSFEQKTDYYVTPSHQKIFVEVWNPLKNSPAGVCITTGDFFVYDLPYLNSAYVFKTDSFKNYFFHNIGSFDYKLETEKRKSRGYIVPLNIIDYVKHKIVPYV